MSIVTIWTNDKFAAVCCDGRLSRRGNDGQLIPVREDYPKFEAITEHIVIAGTGSEFVFDKLVRVAAALAAESKDSPGLFSCLEAMIPLQARHFLACGAEQFDQPPEVALALVGFDAAQRRIRCLSWNSNDNLAVEEHGSGTGCFGNDDAVPAARILLKQLNDGHQVTELDEVLPAMERIVVSVSEQVPHSVNKNVKAHLVVAPEKPRDCVMDGTRAAWASVTQKNAAVDASGNLLLKNINNPVGSTANPTQGSGTYAVIPEMTVTITTKGNKVLINFSCNFSISATSGLNSGEAFFAYFLDGVQVTQDFRWDIQTNDEANFEKIAHLNYVDAPSAGSHTFDIRWKYVGSASNHILAIGTARQLQVIELG